MNIEDLLKRISFLEQLAQGTLSTKTSDRYSSYIASAPFHGFRSSTLSFLKATFGESHPFYDEFNQNTSRAGYYELLSGIEILKSIKAEIENGWLKSYKGLISAEIFSDFLEMGEHLLKEGYKDAGAVIIGSVLEDSLRRLADINGIATINEKGKYLTIDPLNTELALKGIYNKLVQKQITSWADLRNNAAHGHFDKYEGKQVEMMLLFVQSFCSDYLE